MDATTTVQDLKDRCAAFCRARDWERFHTPKEMAVGVVTEAGELLAEFRFKSDAESRALVADPAKREALPGGGGEEPPAVRGRAGRSVTEPAMRSST